MATTPITQEITFDTSAPPRSLWSDAMRRLMRNKMAVASIVVILFFALVALTAPIIAPHDPTFQTRATAAKGNGGTRLPPQWAPGGKPGYILGTDLSGRDVLSRIMYGAQVSLSVGFVPMLIVISIGTFVGMNAGFRGGWVDNLLMRLTDIT
jgi:oligopeptide transport system permease protein